MNSTSRTILWSDRKRYLGLPLSFTKYEITNDRLYVNTGFLNSKTDEILLYRILDVKSSRSLGQKLFGVGTITLYCADQSTRTLELKNVKDPNRVHRFISDVVENVRTQRGVTGRELIGTAGLSMDHVDGHCDAICSSNEPDDLSDS